MQGRVHHLKVTHKNRKKKKIIKTGLLTIGPLVAAKVIVHVLLVPGFIWLMLDEDSVLVVFIERLKNGRSSHRVLLLHMTSGIWSIGNRPLWNF